MVLAYDLLEDRRIDDDSSRIKFFEFFFNFEFEPITILCLDIRSLYSAIFVSEKVAKFEIKRHFFPCILIFVLYKTNRFHVAVGLFSNRSQITSKCGKNKKWHKRSS